MSLQITTPDDTTIVLTRSFKAPRRIVWDALTSPDKMRRWMLPPPGMTLAVCEVEPRLGGTLRLTWKTAEADPFMMLEGEWTEFSPHERMVHTETIKTASGDVVSDLLETHELTEKGGVTQLRITQVYKRKDDRDAALASGMNEGMEACYQQLDTVLAQ
jgi:uncharacterized protein YndB with AHSA1/START domain